MRAERLSPYARLPRAYRDLHLRHSTVDAFGGVHWLLTEHAKPPTPYDALVVTVTDGGSRTTWLGPVSARFPQLGSLPDGGFVVADARSRDGDDQVQVFDALGRPAWAFRVGDGIEHLLTDEAGDLWVGYFDEGVFGDPLSAPGARRWSRTGTPLWEYRPPAGVDQIADCYALNVGRAATWVYPYTRFPLVEIGGDDSFRARTTEVRGAKGVAVHEERVAFLGGYRGAHDLLTLARLTETSVETTGTALLTRPDGTPPGRRRRVVSRGSRLYVQEEPYIEWSVFEVEAS
ncbi:hypothetical protein [Streptomyces stelliscabiei]|uniref:hypothetical protein n=1 Tax=Streptomyces stelliscabiei TaxID=146820 RepID=UPI0029B8E804|nr:hypothetical protein [Streptomyces stelliscabiei]MDX2555302.1 hypothetical protein [Streptomyces stelliscabiei]MDX2612991.1 hypothetical protein [Streptomyces stelliscabiei]MDX2637466.1 hypothetical protein [Streptomyces stelliscabiei]MDX2663336.1 hypothetical protein [Streptomyces stelliscabiei]MDX2711982.1 hypothetical protein [Streptomyces stelliscabiei]